MALSFTKLFQPAQIAATATAYFTMPTSPTSSLLRNGRVRVSNTSAGAVTVTLYAVPSGGTAGDDNTIVLDYAVGANSFIDFDIPTLAAGDEIQALAGAATSLTIHAMDGVIYS